ncbi:ATP-binding protein [Streptomyces sp. NPDC051907]|uniref:ATP-binding protein n=1 Tax=Streptomyces sp. NPDC051907 TaxID=3155284 RepID=UPI00341E3C91
MTAPAAPIAPLQPVEQTMIALPPGPEAPADARRAARDFLDALRPPLPADRREDVLLIVSELVTNAVRHAPSPYALVLTADVGALDIAVADGSPVAPAPRSPDLTDGTGGMGWHIAECLGAALSTEPLADGKRVHATLAERPGLRGDVCAPAGVV